MSEIPSVIHTRATLEGGAPKLVFALDEDAVRLTGLNSRHGLRASSRHARGR